MSTLLRSAIVLRRAARVVAPLGATLGLAALVVLDAAEPLDPVVAAASALAIGALLLRASRRKLRAPAGALSADVELAWTLQEMKWDPEKSEVVVIPPFTDIRSVQTLVDGDKLSIGYGAQDVSEHDGGAYTGEISGAMLAKLGCQ